MDIVFFLVFSTLDEPRRSMKTKQQKPQDLLILEDLNLSQSSDELCAVQVTLLVMNSESLGFPDFWMPLPTPTWQISKL